ncbi:hypothetical protein [Kribbella sp. NPDC051137]|uniref:hypothetical protein n=1 Tax=Kribbella sp. NPDC051137 TaxID=3155045 RepID=UPI00342B9454
MRRLPRPVRRELDGLGRVTLVGNSLGAFVAGSMPLATVSAIEVGHRIHTHAPRRWCDEVTPFLAFKEG